MPPNTTKTKSSRKHRWGVVLAGGDGARLQRLTRLISSDERPKQFSALVSRETLLEQTRQRALRSIAQDQILYTFASRHLEYYAKEHIEPSHRIVQPLNKGTAPAIAFSLLSIEQIDKDAIVAILPSDHYYADERAFNKTLDSAFRVAARYPRSVVILGAAPHGPEVEYGWIDLGPSAVPGAHSLFHVESFCEKPPFPVAQRLLERGSLWNTFIMVGHVSGFLNMIDAATSRLMHALRAARLWNGSEVHIPESLYGDLSPVDFSKAVLSVQVKRLIALRMDEAAGWSDLGHPDRVMAILKARGLNPWWMNALTGPSSEGPPMAVAAVA